MIYATPMLQDTDHDVLGQIQDQSDRLRLYTQDTPRRWMGSLRRNAMARAIQGSNSIEGYNASVDDVMAAINNEQPHGASPETWLAIKGYRDAMTYIIQAAQDPTFEFSKQFLKSLHFMMVGYDLSKHPGQWRPGAVFVISTETGDVVYEGPDASVVNALMGELVAILETKDSTPVHVKAAMAHLNLTMIHPFKDGNGRMARALQTLIMARHGVLHPVFCSIEEWLGQHTRAYYDVLSQVGQGGWNPHHDALPWVRFCLEAHYAQCVRLLRRNAEYEALYGLVLKLVQDQKLPERCTLPLFDAAIGARLTNAKYRTDADVTDFVANKDLKRLCDLSLIVARGANRGRIYEASDLLMRLRQATRQRRRVSSPYNAMPI